MSFSGFDKRMLFGAAVFALSACGEKPANTVDPMCLNQEVGTYDDAYRVSKVARTLARDGVTPSDLAFLSGKMERERCNFNALQFANAFSFEQHPGDIDARNLTSDATVVYFDRLFPDVEKAARENPPQD